MHTICPLAKRGRGYLLQSSDFRSPDPKSGAPEGRSAQSLSRPVRAGFPIRGLAGSPVLRRLVLGSAVLIAATAAMAGIAAAVGPYAMPPLHAVGVILDLAGLADSAATATERAIVETIRLPRIVLALLVGGALGVSGAIMPGTVPEPDGRSWHHRRIDGGARRARSSQSQSAPMRRSRLPCRLWHSPGRRGPWRWCTRWLQRAGDFLWPRCCLPALL